MARIGKQIPHSEFVDNASIQAAFSSDKKFRYLLSMQFNRTLLDTDRSRVAVVILKNPSAANHKMADPTIRRVETYLFHRLPDVREVHVLNIFAFRATEPEDLNTEYAEKGPMAVIGPENDHVITSTLRASDYTLLAWGNNSGIDPGLYEERIIRVKQLIRAIPGQRVYHVTGKKQTKHPLHGLMWGYEYTIESIGDYLLKE